MARSGTVVGSADVGTGAGGVGASSDAGVKATGGSKSPKVVSPNLSVNNPVHIAFHIGSRENICVGGMINGSHGGPIVVITVPSDVPFPKPQVGQARSLILSGAIPSV